MLASRCSACLRAVAILLFASSFGVAATITVTPTVTPSGSLFHYAYSISNSSPDDAFVVDIPVPAAPSAVLDLSAPIGFTTSFDSGLGLVSFLEDTSKFGSTPVSGFSFDSPDAPGSVSFTATLVNASGSLFTLSGPTLAPVPEPASWPAVLLLVPAVAWLRQQRSGRSRDLAKEKLN